MNSARELQSRFRRLVPRVLRVTAASAVTGMFFSLVLAGKVYGDVNDMTVHLGDDLAKIPVERGTDGLVAGDAYRLHINGASLQTSTALTRSSVAEVLSRAEDDCKLHADGMASDFSRLDTTAQQNAAHTERGVPGLGVVHVEIPDQRGYVLCFATEQELAPYESWTRVKEAAMSGEVSKIGHLRYLSARKLDGLTQVSAVWTDQPFNLFKMFPRQGDAPGSDPTGVPRPEGSRRIFSAYAEGGPALISTYDVPLNRADAYRFYQEKLPKAGFEPRMWADDPGLGTAYGNQIGDYVILAQEAAPGHATVTITESRNRRVVAEVKSE